MNTTLTEAQMQNIMLSYEIMFWMYDVVLPMILFPGMFVTFASAVIFGQKLRSTAGFAGRERCSGSESLHTLLFGLSLFDFFVLVNATLVYLPMGLCNHSASKIACSIFDSTMLFTYPLSLIAQFCSVWTCTAITIDRFLVVRYPLQSRKWCTTKKTFCVLLGISIAAVVYRIPAMFEWSHNEQGQVSPTELRQNAVYHQIYHFYCSLFIMFIIPWCVMIVLNIIIYRSIREAFVQRRSIIANRKKDTSKERRKPFMMAILVVLTFMLFNMLALINHLWESIIPQPDPASASYISHRCLVSLSNILICCNSACNFFIYCALGRWFRQSFISTFCFPCVFLKQKCKTEADSDKSDDLVIYASKFSYGTTNNTTKTTKLSKMPVLDEKEIEAVQILANRHNNPPKKVTLKPPEDDDDNILLE